MTPEPLSSSFESGGASIWGGGYDYLQSPQHVGWHAVASWGEDGWDLGSWPLVIVSVRAEPIPRIDADRYGMRIYTEGDLDTRWYASKEALFAAIDEWVAWWWRSRQSRAPEGLPMSGPVPERFRGPYSTRRSVERIAGQG